MSAQAFTGYVPRIDLPIVALPPDSFTGQPAAYYQQLQLMLDVAPSGPNDEFADIGLSPDPNGTATPDPTLFAMAGGFVRCFPAGATIPSPDGFSDPARDSLMLTVWIGDIEAQQRGFPPDTPPVARIYYVGIDAVATAATLRLQTALMSEAALRASWKAEQFTSAPSGTTPDQLIDAHNLRVMTGVGSVFVDPGTAIGKAAPDIGGPVGSFRFTLRVSAAGAPPTYVSPLPLFAGAPDFEL